MESRGIVYQLIARFLEHARNKTEVCDTRIQKCLTYIRRNLDQPLRIETLAEKVCISKDHFIRLFRKETGLTPIRYINQKKVEKARLLLITDNVPVKEIALLLAYDDYSYFNRIFRKYTGTSPLEYRKNSHKQ